MASCAVPRVYARRRPEKTQLYRAVAENLDLFYDTYDERFLTQHGPLSSHARQTLEGYIRCGRLPFGCSRAKCEDCGDEFLVAFSCQLRGICSSCQQKRAEILCRFIEEEVAEPVDHRQHVFVLPKMFRRIFHSNREMLGKLCRASNEATQEFYRVGLGRDDVCAGIVTTPQLFGDAVNPHCHIHSVVTDGAFDAEGNFHRLLYDAGQDTKTLTKLFECKVLALLVKEGRLGERMRDEMLSWEHTGFSVDASVRIHKGDREGLRRLVRYMARPAVSIERVNYNESTGKVIVRSCKKVNGQRPVKAEYDALTFLALLALQVPPRGVHMVRYYGHYSTRSRAKRRERTRGHRQRPDMPVPEVPSPEVKERRRRWATLIRKVFEVDPLACECGGRLRFVSFITTAQQDVIDRILDHLGESTEMPRSTGPPKWYELTLARQHVEANAHVYDGYDDSHDHDHGHYDADAAWSPGDWDQA